MDKSGLCFGQNITAQKHDERAKFSMDLVHQKMFLNNL